MAVSSLLSSLKLRLTSIGGKNATIKRSEVSLLVPRLVFGVTINQHAERAMPVFCTNKIDEGRLLTVSSKTFFQFTIQIYVRRSFFSTGLGISQLNNFIKYHNDYHSGQARLDLTLISQSKEFNLLRSASYLNPISIIESILPTGFLISKMAKFSPVA